jgi:hypothetical protein
VFKRARAGVDESAPAAERRGEVAIPAYELMQENGTSERMLDVWRAGFRPVSMPRCCRRWLQAAGVSKSTLSREAAEGGEQALKGLLERGWEEIDLPVIYIDGMHFGVLRDAFRCAKRARTCTHPVSPKFTKTWDR